MQLLPSGHNSQACLLDDWKVFVGQVCTKNLLGAASVLDGVEQLPPPMAEYLPLLQVEADPLEHEEPAGQGSQPTLPPLAPTTTLPEQVVDDCVGSAQTSVPVHETQLLLSTF